MNVLIYNGNGASKACLSRTFQCLFPFVVPQYSMRYVDAYTLEHDPWTGNTALLVIPGGRDLGYCSSFNDIIYRKIKEYVRRGGSYLGLCAGGYFASANVDFRMPDKDLNVIGSRKLQFFPGTCAGPTFPGFAYDSEEGARAAPLILEQMKGSNPTTTTTRIYYNGGGSFVNAESYPKVRVVARYTEVEKERSAAIIYIPIGSGHVVLTSVHPEFGSDGNNILDEYDEPMRLELIAHILKLLGLKVPENISECCAQPKVTDQYLIPCNESTNRLFDRFKENNLHNTLDDKTYNFHFKDLSDHQVVSESSTSNLASIDELGQEMKPSVCICYGNEEAEYEYTKSHFDYKLYLMNLKDCHFGSPILISPVIRSTQTLFDRNPKFLEGLPTGFTAFANYQTEGRGRGQNMWVSPYGVLAFSFIINVPSHSFSTTPVALFQYLMALSVVNGIRNYGPGYEDIPAFIKWPNDVYACVNEGGPLYPKKKYMKLSGIIVTSTYEKDVLHLVIGCGVNVSNLGPTVSLNALVDELNKHHPERSLKHFQFEILLAKIFNYFEHYYYTLLQDGFARILPEYYQHWLHNEQVVNLPTGEKARIKGITSDFGLLVADLLTDSGTTYGKSVYLQPDGNSFDLMKNLITKKT
ncbi:biotin-protein ligase [Schizosaccharomyces cryophilus OY26]|uniref:Biotin-protein ligase n=1 Tax=Schizosaccharomyces cryophilus (strain OY26 / ATCC MYA-4695 / CBS 11777 / NBRC 106824 / NRRL Y48691) TaxID=653667 RepID=S9W5Z6_SCHCR|nr:biotin-protein ligase [Schizosaccharomyces cryophilus OY26]EPY53984.1 biotin-protein ligase [Schizosaccharomyces cryophilus OY26]